MLLCVYTSYYYGLNPLRQVGAAQGPGPQIGWRHGMDTVLGNLTSYFQAI